MADGGRRRPGRRPGRPRERARDVGTVERDGLQPELLQQLDPRVGEAQVGEEDAVDALRAREVAVAVGLLRRDRRRPPAAAAPGCGPRARARRPAMNAMKNGSAPSTSGSRAITRPIACSRRPPSERAEALGSQPSSSATPRIRSRVSSATPGRPLSANDTAAVDTPAWRATSTIVGPRRRLLGPPTSGFMPDLSGHKTFKSDSSREVPRCAVLCSRCCWYCSFQGSREARR